MLKKLFLFIICAAGAFTLVGKNEHNTEMNSILASVNGEVVSLKDVLMLTRNQEYLAYAAFSGERLAEEIKSIRRKAVDEIIDRKLLVAEYYKQSFRISQWDIEHEIDRTALRMGCRSRDEFRSKMMAEKVDFERFRKELEERMIHFTMLQRLTLIEGDVSPKEIYEYFQSHRQELSGSENYELAMLKIEKARADFSAAKEEVTAALSTAPECFHEMVSKFNPGSNDGKTVSIEPGKMRIEFAEALKEPVEGKVYGPIELADGMAWIKLIKHNRAGNAGFGEVQARIKKIIEAEKQQKALTVYMAELRKNAVLEYFF